MQTMKWLGLLTLVLSTTLLAEDQKTPQRQREMVVNFAKLRQQQMLAEAKEKHLETPKLFNKLFEAVIRYDWPATSNLFFQIKRGIGQYKDSQPDPALNTELWQYVMETFGACEQAATWSPVMLQRYEEEVMRPLTTNCIYFGGTDPGRFVPTVLRETSSKQFHVITQNALADGLYMTFLRKRSDASVRLPTPEQANEAFRQYVEDVQAGRLQAGADVKVEDGQVVVHGIGGVMAINGILAKWIFDANKDKHDFFIEESYPLPWMYSYLVPAGVILKLEKEPLPTPQENGKFWTNILYQDSTFWEQLLGEFSKHPEFKTDPVARSAFSKLRCAIAGIYEFRGIVKAADFAYQQALVICPENPEASFRLANLYMRLNRADMAIETLAKLAKLVPSNKQVHEALQQFKEFQRTHSATNQAAPVNTAPK